MVITSPFSSIKGFIVTKPPLVLFTLCLIGFAVTTFTFAYYVEHKDDLPNVDAQRDFVSLLGFLSKRQLCITQNEFATNSNESDLYKDITTVFVKAKLKNKAVLQNFTNIQGYVFTSDWMSECSSTKLDKLKISFALPQLIHATSNLSDVDVCVSITGPKSFLTPASSEKHCYGSLASTHIISGYILNKNPNTCTEGIPTYISYLSNSHNADLLTSHDRSIINLHLFHTSYFLLVMAITLICYAMIKGKPVVMHQSLDKILIDN